MELCRGADHRYVLSPSFLILPQQALWTAAPASIAPLPPSSLPTVALVTLLGAFGLTFWFTTFVPNPCHLIATPFPHFLSRCNLKAKVYMCANATGFHRNSNPSPSKSSPLRARASSLDLGWLRCSALWGFMYEKRKMAGSGEPGGKGITTTGKDHIGV